MYSFKGSPVGQKKRLIIFMSMMVLLVSFVSILGVTPVSAQVQLNGNFDAVSLQNGGQTTSVAGWACAPGEPNRILRVDVYNVADNNRYLGTVSANLPRESAVGALCGGNPNHGFNGTVGGVCVSRSGPTPVDIRAFAVYTDSPPVNLDLPGVRLSFNTFC